MNNEQLESCLKKLKSSSSGPDSIDDRLEERMMQEFLKMKSKRSRKKMLTGILAVCLIGGTSFVALGGDSAIMNYISPPTERDAEGNPIPNFESIGSWIIRHAHAHFESFHRMHHSPSDEK